MYHNLKAFQVKFNLKFVKGKKTPYLDNDIIMNAQKDHRNTRIELGNDDFRDQRILISKNSYVPKIKQKCAWVSHFDFLCIRLLSSYDDKGSENITEKRNLRSFSLHRVYFASLGL